MERRRLMEWGYDLAIYSEYGISIPIRLNIETHCHALITGASGSGKSYGLIYLIGKLLQSCEDIEIYFCDFKNSKDFKFMSDLHNYYTGKNCYDGIMNYYEKFTTAREKGEVDKRHLLICDEYPAFINYLQMRDKRDKTKCANDVLSAISEVLMLGRGTGLGYGLWIVTQRADNTLFTNGARDNFMIIVGLGKLSKEQKGMVFASEDIPDRIYKQGEGIILADGKALKEVKYPLIDDVDDWKQHILAILMRNGGACANREV